jgi:hypothetical protein
MLTQALVISAAFQLTSAIASVGRVKTASHVISRRFNALALGTVAADFAVKYLYTGGVDFLVGLIVFVVLTARTLLILGFIRIEGRLSGVASRARPRFSSAPPRPSRASST